MKTILILGDSWGVPNYYKDLGCEPEEHTEFRLKNLGYEVLNFSLNGGSMIETIEYARRTLKKLTEDNDYIFNSKRRIDGLIKETPVPNYYGQKIDWVLWFHTETIRNFDQTHQLFLPYLSCEEYHEIGCKISYRAFANLIDIIGKNVKTAIIGGQAPVDPRLYDYHTPNFIIEDWRSELVGRKLPYCYTLSRPNFVDKAYDNLDKKLEILNVHKEIMDSMSDKSIFFDRCHPGSVPHKELTDKLHILFQTQ